MSSCFDGVRGIWRSGELVSRDGLQLVNWKHATHVELCKEGPLNEPANVFGAISIKAELVNEFVL